MQGVAEGFSAGAGDPYGEDLHGLGTSLGRVVGGVEGVVDAVFEGGHISVLGEKVLRQRVVVRNGWTCAIVEAN